MFPFVNETFAIGVLCFFFSLHSVFPSLLPFYFVITFLKNMKRRRKKTKNEYNFFVLRLKLSFNGFYHWMIYPHGSRSFNETDLTNTMWLFMTRIIVIVIAFITLICCYFHANSTNCRWTVAASIFMNKCKHLVLSCVNSTLFI